MYTLILADGTRLTGLTRNGDCFYSEKQINESKFLNNLSTLTIMDGDTEEEVLHNAVLIRQVETPDGWRLAFRELSPKELSDMAVAAKIDYIAMMTDIDLEEV